MEPRWIVMVLLIPNYQGIINFLWIPFSLREPPNFIGMMGWYRMIPHIPALPRDPRSQILRIWNKTRLETLDLPVPRFKIDVNYIGEPPSIEVTIFHLNDNIDKQFLLEMVQKFGTVEELFIYYHPTDEQTPWNWQGRL
ncbi:hypothetical protein NQ317_015508 [Molorchus minor]|uniref:Uncharacterized protein n=1 Tax=Molorchus minor TaxID=1323400 RepID=A0ABQ9JKQ0_9CUCU|nr:hypothetical protein NQ317_015508 [Molorchus minor]